jgi:HEAT repeat protein
MGLFDYFTQEGKLKRHAARVTNRDAQPEDREASVRWLSDDGSPKALVALLGRFDMNLTQGLKDKSERDWVYQLLLGKGAALREPLDHHLKACKQFHLPLRLLEEIAGADAATAKALELLDAERSRSAFYPEKKKNLLVWLAERTHPTAIAQVTEFLSDFDEEVRYAAIEVMAKQGSDDARAPLLEALLRPGEDSGRVRHRICELFKARGWSVAGVDLGRALAPGFSVVDDRIQ